MSGMSNSKSQTKRNSSILGRLCSLVVASMQFRERKLDYKTFSHADKTAIYLNDGSKKCLYICFNTVQGWGVGRTHRSIQLAPRHAVHSFN